MENKPGWGAVEAAERPVRKPLMEYQCAVMDLVRRGQIVAVLGLLDVERQELVHGRT